MGWRLLANDGCDDVKVSFFGWVMGGRRGLMILQASQ
jgi:hypothetical protein